MAAELDAVRAIAVALLSGLVLLAAADARAQGPMFAERGLYASALLTGGEWDGPKPTADTDLGLFRGLGLAGALDRAEVTMSFVGWRGNF